MNNELIITERNSTTADSVLEELWRVKDARAAQFGNAAGLMQHLQATYGVQPALFCKNSTMLKPSAINTVATR